VIQQEYFSSKVQEMYLQLL